LIQLWWL